MQLRRTLSSTIRERSRFYFPYTAQDETKTGLDPFAVIGKRADSAGLTQRGARLHARIAVKHVYERSGRVTDGTEHVSQAGFKPLTLSAR